MPRKDGNKELKDLKKKFEATKNNIIRKREMLAEIGEDLTPEQQNIAKTKLNNKMGTIKKLKNTF